MNELNQVTAEQFDVTNALLASIASNMTDGGIGVKSWADVQRVVRMGIADKIFTVGDQLMADWNGTPRVWDITGIDHDTPTIQGLFPQSNHSGS